jgi:myo-inositol-1(or 4)-monophosphatase
VSRCPDLDRALTATGFPYDRRTARNNNVDHFAAMLRRCQGIRRFGSAGLDLAWTAAGRYDLYWEQRLKPWDVAAGLLLLDEAGGRATDLDGLPFDLARGDVMVSRGGLVHAQALAALREVRASL